MQMMNTGADPGAGRPAPVPARFKKLQPDVKSAKAPDIAIAVGIPKKGPDAAEESAETPAQEGGEEYGAKLMSDIEAVGKRYGADPATSRQIAADMFDAMAKCLSGGAPGENQMDEEVSA